MHHLSVLYTGAPKGIVSTNKSVLHSLELMKSITQTNHQTIELSFLPHYDSFGLLYSYLLPLYCGARTYHMSPSVFTDKPTQWLECVSAYKATHSQVNNSALELILRHSDTQDINLSSVQCVTIAQPTNPSTIQTFETKFAPFGLRKNTIRATYCPAEGTVCVCGVQPDHNDCTVNNDYISYIVPAGVMVVDPSTCTEMTERVQGEVWVCKGPSMPLGYWNNISDTQGTFEATIHSINKHIRTGTHAVLVHNNYNAGAYVALVASICHCPEFT